MNTTIVKMVICSTLVRYTVKGIQKAEILACYKISVGSQEQIFFRNLHFSMSKLESACQNPSAYKGHKDYLEKSEKGPP